MRKQAEEDFIRAKQAYDVLNDSKNNPYRTPPKLDITPKYIRFKDVELGQKKTTTFTINNVGGPYSKIWIDDAPAHWLHVINLKSLTTEELPLEVTVEATGTGEPAKQYACNLVVRLENEQTKSKDEATVKVELALKAEPAKLRVDANTIEVKYAQPGHPEIRTFELSNIGRGSLQVNISTTKPWLSVSPNSGTIAPLAKSTYTITLTTESLPYGFADTDFISINTNGGNATILVDLSIAPSPPYKEPPEPKKYQVREIKRDVFSLKKFTNTLLLFIFVPFIPPVLFITIALLSSFWHESGLRVGLVIYGLVAIAVSTGRGWQEDKQIISISAPRPESPHTTPAGQPAASVIVNSSSLVYHKPSCIWVRRISSSNRASLTVEEAVKRGYSRCKLCRP
jgi:hypothetical protein